MDQVAPEFLGRMLLGIGAAMKDGDDVRLDSLQAHQFAVIRHIEAPDDDSERLMSLGVCTGRTVELIKAGDPLILKVFASRLGLSARLARRVFVQPIDQQPPPG